MRTWRHRSDLPNARGRRVGRAPVGPVVLLKAFNRLGLLPRVGRGARRGGRAHPPGSAAARACRPGVRLGPHGRAAPHPGRARSEEVRDPAGARKVAADAIEEAARRKNEPADLINIVLELLVEGRYELPGNIFTKLAIGSRRKRRQAPSTLGHRTRGPSDWRSGRRRPAGSRPATY